MQPNCPCIRCILFQISSPSLLIASSFSRPRSAQESRYHNDQIILVEKVFFPMEQLTYVIEI